MTTTRIGLLLFPRLTQLDLTGPFEVFAKMPGATGASGVEVTGTGRCGNRHAHPS